MSATIETLGGSEALAHYPFVALLALLAFCFIYFSEFFLGKCLEVHHVGSKKRKMRRDMIREGNDAHDSNRVHSSTSVSPEHSNTDEDHNDNHKQETIQVHNVQGEKTHHDDASTIPHVDPKDTPLTKKDSNQDISLIEVASPRMTAREDSSKPASSDSTDHNRESDPILKMDNPADAYSSLSRRGSPAESEEGRSSHDTESPPILEDEHHDNHGEMCLSHQPKKFHDHHTHHFDLLVDHHASLAQIVTRGLVLWLSLSLHSFLAGLGLGSETNMSAVWTLIVAIIVHKLFEAYALGDVLREGMKKKKILIAVLLILMYSVTTSVGVGIGMGVSLVDNAWFQLLSNVLLAFAVGALIHVGLFELLFHHMISETTLYITIPYLILFMVGVAGVAVMGIFHDATHADHEH